MGTVYWTTRTFQCAKCKAIWESDVKDPYCRRCGWHDLAEIKHT